MVSIQERVIVQWRAYGTCFKIMNVRYTLNPYCIFVQKMNIETSLNKFELKKPDIKKKVSWPKSFLESCLWKDPNNVLFLVWFLPAFPTSRPWQRFDVSLISTYNSYAIVIFGKKIIDFKLISKYLVEPFLRSLRSKDVCCWILWFWPRIIFP